MDPYDDVELLWIADEGLTAEDPAGWDKSETPKGEQYYTHSVTQQVLWQHPLDYYFGEVYAALKRKESIPQLPGTGKALMRRVAAKAEEYLGTGQSAVEVNDDSPPETVALRLQQITGRTSGTIRQLLTEPVRTEAPIQCYLTRTKVGSALTYQLRMVLSPSFDLLCFTARVVSGKSLRQPNDGRCYLISYKAEDHLLHDGEDDLDDTICTVRSDRPAMEYTVVDSETPHQEILHAHFITSCRDVQNLPVVDVAIPAVDAHGVPGKIAAPTQPPNKGKLLELLNGSQKGLTVFANKKPIWSEESGMPVLDFYGRALLASSKNMQLTPKAGNEEELDFHFLMGKVDDTKTNVDFIGPMSPLQACAFALILFDNASAPMKDRAAAPPPR